MIAPTVASLFLVYSNRVSTFSLYGSCNTYSYFDLRTIFKTVCKEKCSFLVYGYRKLSNKKILSNDCDEYKYGTFFGLDEAKHACKDDANCSGIYDLNCGVDSTFHLCPNTDDVLKDSTASCVHTKIIIGKLRG